ncbi:hypothetical protein ACFQS1_02550 [Paractinoplanes rhizophilus]|jgi:hypothetical protein|uniref:Holin n=1 Tax=Paractinoplanes rhizophilus TaxID=1416877 RepID=A0ABW2HLE4_9ACTN|nr:hypothetical protein [Actinoplanes sp.]
MSASGKKLMGLLGALLITAGVAATIVGMFLDKDINSVGLAAIFIAGIGLVYAGIFGLLPEEIGIGDKGKIKLQAAADAVKTVKEGTNSEAAAIAQSPELIKNVIAAKEESEASAVVEGALKQLVERMPATADVLKTVA